MIARLGENWIEAALILVAFCLALAINYFLSRHERRWGLVLVGTLGSTIFTPLVFYLMKTILEGPERRKDEAFKSQVTQALVQDDKGPLIDENIRLRSELLARPAQAFRSQSIDELLESARDEASELRRQEEVRAENQQIALDRMRLQWEPVFRLTKELFDERITELREHLTVEVEPGTAQLFASAEEENVSGTVRRAVIQGVEVVFSTSQIGGTRGRMRPRPGAPHISIRAVVPAGVKAPGSSDGLSIRFSRDLMQVRIGSEPDVNVQAVQAGQGDPEVASLVRRGINEALQTALVIREMSSSPSEPRP